MRSVRSPRSEVYRLRACWRTRVLADAWRNAGAQGARPESVRAACPVAIARGQGDAVAEPESVRAACPVAIRML